VASEPKRSNSLRFNCDLVMAEFARWPVATLVVMVALTVAILFVPYGQSVKSDGSPLSAIDRALLIAAQLLTILEIKASHGLFVYPQRHKSPFPGSYLISSLIVLAPFFTGFAAFIGALASENFPVIGRIIFVLFSYALFSVFFAGFLRIQHAIMAMGRPKDPRP
jgi:hypothetical protein